MTASFQTWSFLRKGWDSNPRSVISRTHDFQSCALDQLSHLCVCCVYGDTVHFSAVPEYSPSRLIIISRSGEIVKGILRFFPGNRVDFPGGIWYTERADGAAACHGAARYWHEESPGIEGQDNG